MLSTYTADNTILSQIWDTKNTETNVSTTVSQKIRLGYRCHYLNSRTFFFSPNRSHWPAVGVANIHRSHFLSEAEALGGRQDSRPSSRARDPAYQTAPGRSSQGRRAENGGEFFCVLMHVMYNKNFGVGDGARLFDIPRGSELFTRPSVC